MTYTHCRGCGHGLNPPRADGLCVYEMGRERQDCTAKWMRWLPNAMAAHVNGTNLDHPFRVIAIDEWLAATR